MTEAPNPKPTLLLTLGLVVAGIVIAAVSGFKTGSIIGAVVAAAGAIPAVRGIWLGMQQKTQGALGGALALLLVSLAVAVVLLLAGITGFFR